MKQGGNQAAGFTIVETMIVLAVTSALFVSAVILINGRQNKVAFQTAINNLQQHIQQIINETTSGYYPNNGTTFSCDATPGSAPTISATNREQGTNGSCIFLGKAIRFGAGYSGAPGYNGDDNNTLTVYPIAGNRLDASKNEVAYDTSYTYANAHPTIIAPGVSSGTHATIPDDSVTYTAESGLSFARASYTSYSGVVNNSTAHIAAVAIVGSLASYATGGGGSQSCNGLCSGGQQYLLYGFGNAATYPWATAVGGPSAVEAMDAGGVSQHYATVGLCFDSGTTNQSGLITIGNNGSLTVGLQIFSRRNCT